MCRTRRRRWPNSDLALTTNGATFRLLAHELRDAGLRAGQHQPRHAARAIGSSQMTRRDELDRVLDGIDAANEAGFDPVKVNAVVQRGVNDDEIVDLAAFGRDNGVEVRFIEFMPLDAGGRWADGDGRQPGRDRRRASTPCSRSSRCRHGARRRPTAGATSTARGDVGVIPSVTKPFCGDCDRVRLTAEGQFRTCLFAIDEFDLRAAAARAAPTTTTWPPRSQRAVGTQVGRAPDRPGRLRPPASAR